MEQMLATEEFRAIAKFFGEFRDVCTANHIKPVIMYIPTALQIYAPYTTAATGSHWLAMRDQQIAVRENIENAITVLANETRVDLITLTPVFNRAAAEGKMLYYSLDAHWNAEGREIAARFVAAALNKFHSGNPLVGSSLAAIAGENEGLNLTCRIPKPPCLLGVTEMQKQRLALNEVVTRCKQREHVNV
jgi:SGNH hydrolase-like domain, acetyltransferase AlgX